LTHPALSNLSNIVREHWTTIQKHPELCKIFKEPPVLAFRKPKSLKDILVKADMKTTNCTFQEVDNIFCLAVGIAVYDEFFSCMCAAEFLCALDVEMSSEKEGLQQCEHLPLF
jgi:hypothetical protein